MCFWSPPRCWPRRGIRSSRSPNRGFFLGRPRSGVRSGADRFIGLLSGVQRGYEMHVVDLATGGLKRDLVEGLGAHYHSGDAAEVDVDAEVVIECTGVGCRGQGGGSPAGQRRDHVPDRDHDVDPTPDVDTTVMNRAMVLRNTVMFGSVNAGRRHWEQAVAALAAADPKWLSAMVTRRVPLERWAEALNRGPTMSRSSSTCAHERPAVSVWSPEPGLLSEGPRWHEQRQELCWSIFSGAGFTVPP